MIITRSGRAVTDIPLSPNCGLFTTATKLNADCPGEGRKGDTILRAYAIVPFEWMDKIGEHPAAIGLINLYCRRRALSKFPLQRPIISLEDSMKVIRLYETAMALNGTRNVEVNVNELFDGSESMEEESLDATLARMDYPEG